MAENKSTELTPRRKKLIYSLIVAIAVLMIATATALTVYFVTRGNDEILDNPPPVDNPDNSDKPDKPDKPDEPDKPSDGDNTVKFVCPLEDEKCVVEYDAIYTNKTLNRIYRHRGVDFEAAEGTQVCAIADGKVTAVSLSEELGNVITLDHGDGLMSYYRFVEPVSDLNVGDTVRQGAVIGTVAKAYGTEADDGTHLHLEIELNGKGVDPSGYFEFTYEEK